MLQLICNLFFFLVSCFLCYVPRYVGAFQAIKEYDNNVYSASRPAGDVRADALYTYVYTRRTTACFILQRGAGGRF